MVISAGQILGVIELPERLAETLLELRQIELLNRQRKLENQQPCVSPINHEAHEGQEGRKMPLGFHNRDDGTASAYLTLLLEGH